MHFLPKANPLYEQISADKIAMPEVLEKLGKGGFTGYLSYTAPGFEAFCVFAKGKLICALSTEAEREKSGFEALSYMFDKVFQVGGEVNVYRMTADLAMCAHSLVVGTKLLHGDEVRQVDVKGLLTRMKAQNLNGVVHFYTAERYAMMFYTNGQPTGFYHDGARSIQASPDEARKVAALPGARLEVCSTKPIEELMHYDLLQVVNLDKLWKSARSRQSALRSAKEPPRPVEPVTEDDPKMLGLVEDLEEVAMAYLSREGRVLIGQCLSEAGGTAALLDADKTGALLKQIEDRARIIDGHARIEEMIDLMQSEIAGRLAV
jgi:hypothetical protein